MVSALYRQEEVMHKKEGSYLLKNVNVHILRAGYAEIELTSC